MDANEALKACRAIVAGLYPTSEASRDTLARFKENFEIVDERLTMLEKVAEAVRPLVIDEYANRAFLAGNPGHFFDPDQEAALKTLKEKG